MLSSHFRAHCLPGHGLLTRFIESGMWIQSEPLVTRVPGVPLVRRMWLACQAGTVARRGYLWVRSLIPPPLLHGSLHGSSQNCENQQQDRASAQF